MKTFSEVLGAVLGVMMLVGFFALTWGGLVWLLAAVTRQSYQRVWGIARDLLKWSAIGVAGVGIGAYYLVSMLELSTK